LVADLVAHRLYFCRNTQREGPPSNFIALGGSGPGFTSSIVTVGCGMSMTMILTPSSVPGLFCPGLPSARSASSTAARMSPFNARCAQSSAIASATVRPSGSPGTMDASLARHASESFAVRGLPPGFPLCPGFQRNAAPCARLASPVIRLFSGDDSLPLAGLYWGMSLSVQSVFGPLGRRQPTEMNWQTFGPIPSPGTIDTATPHKIPSP
jgi:hypothetical protein